MAFLNFNRSIKHLVKVPEFAVLEVDLSKKEKQTNKHKATNISVSPATSWVYGGL